MPSKSQAQHRLMRAVVTGKSDAVPRSVAEEYLRHDRGRSVKSLKERVGKPKKEMRLR
jgi:hypothetical protein